MNNSDDSCILSEQQRELKEKVAKMDVRLSKVEADVGKIRSETQDGFRQGAESMREINSAVANLAHDFGERMTVLERMTAEKEKWGETLRWTVKVIVRVLCALALAAGGITVCKLFFA